MDADRAKPADHSSSPPSRLLVGVGLLLLVGCLVGAIAGKDALAGTLAVLGVGVSVLAVFAPRIGGPVEMGPTGVKFEVDRQQLTTLSAELGERLGDVPTADLATGQAPADPSDEGRTETAQLVRTIEALVRRLESASADGEPDAPVPADTRLEVARGLLSQRRWADAASMLDDYVSSRPDDWDAQFARGAAHANSRAGNTADLSALRAFNEAIAFVPRSEARDWLPRFFGYRGAMLKRLGRYDEAESDLRIARRVATKADDRNDVDYNLAAVYALTGRHDEAMDLVRALAGTRFIAGIKSHADDYFKSIKERSGVQLVRRRPPGVGPPVWETVARSREEAGASRPRRSLVLVQRDSGRSPVARCGGPAHPNPPTDHWRRSP
jgi:hypothetical protein